MVRMVLLAASALLLLSASAEDDPQIPPDVGHVSATGCRLTSRDTGQSALNAKTLETEEIVYWEVVPWAKYQPPKEREWSPGPIVRYEDGVKSLGEASDICGRWLKKVKEAVAHARKKQP